MRQIGHFIGGKQTAGTSGRSGDVFNPNTGEVQAKVAFASKSEVEQAIGNAEAAQGERNRGKRRDAVREDRERTHQLIRACTDRRAVLGADDLQRVEEAVDERVGNPDGDGRGDERENDGADRRVGRELHHSRLIFK